MTGVQTCALPISDLYILATNGIFRSLNNGSEWVNLETPYNTRSFYISPSGNIFGATATDVFYSLDEGDNWSYINAGITDASIRSFTADSDGNIYAGSWGAGVFHANESSLSIVDYEPDVPSVFELFQNYPNPFNPTTNIRYMIPVRSFVTLTIYDLLGREVDQLVNRNLSSGNYTVQWNASAIPSGIYFYTLQAHPQSESSIPAYLETRKLVLLQ